MTPAEEELVTLYAMGELDAGAAADVVRLLNSDSTAADLFADVQQLDGVLQQNFVSEVPVELEAERVEAILAGPPSLGVAAISKSPWLVIGLVASGLLIGISVAADFLLEALGDVAPAAMATGSGSSEEEALVFTEPKLVSSASGHPRADDGELAGGGDRGEARFLRILATDDDPTRRSQADAAFVTWLAERLPPGVVPPRVRQVRADRLGWDGKPLPAIALLGGRSTEPLPGRTVQLLQHFLQSGGTLLIDPVDRSTAEHLRQQLSERLFPGLELRALAGEDPLLKGTDSLRIFGWAKPHGRWLALLIIPDADGDRLGQWRILARALAKPQS